MAWLSRNNISASDKLYNDNLNSLANDDRNWGGDVNGGGYVLSNVILSGSGGFQFLPSPLQVTPSAAGSSCLQLDQTMTTSPPTQLARWTLCKDITAESGSNTGSNFAIGRYNDAGTIIDTPITINRATGVITMGAQQWAGAVNGGGQTLSNVILSGVTVPGTVPTSRVINTPVGSGLSGGGPLTTDLTLVGVVFGASGASHKPGDVPDPGAVTGATRFLREDATWQTMTVMGASGASHAVGLVPDPGAAAGQTKYLREDATWQVPAGGTGGAAQTPWTSHIDAHGFMLYSALQVGIGMVTPRSLLSVIPATNFATPAAANQITIGESSNNSAYGMQLGYTGPSFLGVIQVLNNGVGSSLLLNPGGGNVGIATASPQSLLHVVYPTTGMPPVAALRVEGTSDPNYALVEFKVSNMLWQVGAGSPSSYFPNCWFLYNATTGTYPLFCKSNGYVGIGTQGPASSLTVTAPAAVPSLSATNQIVTVTPGTGGNGQALEIGSYNAAPWATWMQGSYAGNAGFSTPIALQPLGGGVGIGTQAPNAVLDISTPLPSQNTYQSQWWSTDQSGYALKLQTVWGASGIYQKFVGTFAGIDYNLLTFIQNRVGIALSVLPNYALDVAGDVNCSGAFRVAGVAIGSGGGPFNWATGAPYFCTPTGARLVNTVYQNTSSIPVHVTVIATLPAGGNLSVGVGPTSSPNINAGVVSNSGSTQVNNSVHFIVLPGYYYVLTPGGSIAIAGTVEWK